MDEIVEYLRIIEQDSNVDDQEEDDALGDEPVRYDITSYGIDFDVEGLVRRLKKEDVFIPEFQRQYVWNLPEASRFIESLLLGLPVPGIFLAQDQDTGKMLVIDGQQRLLSLKYYYMNEFKPVEGAKTKKLFPLTKVKREFEGKSYEALSTKDRNNLDNSVIHATVVKQETPSQDDTSIYHIFERLNSGGRKLTAQEIRSAVYHGRLMGLLRDLNHDSEWRSIFGEVNDRMKDAELILRFVAFVDGHDKYQKPMTEYLNRFCAKHRNLDDNLMNRYASQFRLCLSTLSRAVGPKVFRPTRGINVALFEACMVGLNNRISKGTPLEDSRVLAAYTKLVQNEDFKALISRATSDEKNVMRRMALATEAFSRA